MEEDKQNVYTQTFSFFHKYFWFLVNLIPWREGQVEESETDLSRNFFGFIYFFLCSPVVFKYALVTETEAKKRWK